MVLAAAAVCGLNGAAQGPLAVQAGSLAQQIAALTAEPGVARAHWGVAVTALDGTPIFGLNEGQFFRPASNTKLYTTAAAMHLLGPETRVRSGVESPEHGVDKAGVLRGDLWFMGLGDANISDRPIPYLSPAERKSRDAEAKAKDAPAVVPKPLWKIDALAAELAQKGLKEVTGDVVGNDTSWPWQPYASDWTIDDAVWGYGAPVSALTVGDNQIEAAVLPGASVGSPAVITLKPDLGYYTIVAHVRTVAEKQPADVIMERTIGSRVVHMYGTVAMGAPDTEQIAIDDPAEYAAMALKAALEAHGVKVDGKAVAKHRAEPLLDDAGKTAPTSFSGTVHRELPPVPKAATRKELESLQCGDFCPALMTTLTSPTLAEDVTVTLKVSQNLHAELLLHRLGKAYGLDGSTAEGARVVRQFLLNAGLDGDDFVLFDGSGLSGHDLVTPRATAKLLAYATTQPWFAPWKAALPVGGEDGSLAGRFAKPPLKDHVFAKTGSLGESRALSGYLDCASGKTVIFSVMVDNHAPGAGTDRDVMDRIVAAIAAAN
jgi:D-alanyl-D-alanine carboxypeptidase/D-alanyl-D-alanine-endopeptidase (penicillin-binding protein 4)